jgi:hypothetical protein
LLDVKLQERSCKPTFVLSFSCFAGASWSTLKHPKVRGRCRQVLSVYNCPEDGTVATAAKVKSLTRESCAKAPEKEGLKVQTAKAPRKLEMIAYY